MASSDSGETVFGRIFGGGSLYCSSSACSDMKTGYSIKHSSANGHVRFNHCDCVWI